MRTQRLSTEYDFLKLKSIIWFGYILFIFSTLTVKGQSYGTLPMGGAGFVSGIITSKTEPNLIYARTDVGGAYRWDNDDKIWIPLNDWASSNETGYLGVESLATDPGNPDNLYMSVGISYFNGGKSAILRSTDRGKTFSVTNVTSLFQVNGNGMGRNSGEKLVVDPNLGSVLFCGSRSNGLFKSTNSGSGWGRVTSLSVTTTTTGNGISFVVFDPTSGTAGSATQTLIVGVSRTGENLYRSDNGGTSFTAIAGAPSTYMPNRAVLSGDSTLYITYTNAAGPYDINSGQIWKYKLSTGHWTNITPAGFTCGFGGISADPNNAKRLVASTLNIYQPQGTSDGDRFFITTNGGTNWVDVVARGFKYDPNGVTWNDFGKIHWAGSIEFDPFNTKKVYVVSGNGVFSTDNIDSTTTVWKFNVRGLEETVPQDVISIENGPVISVVGDYDGCRYTDITKYGPQLRPSMGTTVGLAYAALNPKVIVRTGSKLYYSSDTGNTWKQGTIIGSQGYVSVSADGSTFLHSPENGTATFRSINNGTTWTTALGTNVSNGRTFADPVNSSVFYEYNSGNGKILVSNNGGASFNSSGTAGGGASKHIRTVPGYEGHLWVALYNGGLTRSTNYGATFTKITNVSACSGVGIGKTVPGAKYPTVFIWGTVGGIEGVYFSTDEGWTWNRMNDNDHEWGGLANGQFVVGDMNELGLVYLSTGGRGIVYIKPDYMLSSSSIIIAVDSTSQMNPVILNNDTINWSWTSSDTTIAAVDTEGLVSGKKIGSATITANTGLGKSVKIMVKVVNPVTELLVTPEIDTLEIGQEIQLTATVTPDTATNKAVTWSSINPTVATVSSSGLVKGIKTGTSIITVSTGENHVVRIPIIVGLPIVNITLNTEADTIEVSEKKQLAATISPSNSTDNKITWYSSKSSVASVDTNGLVTGVLKGSAIIYATSSDGSVQATCIITVADKKPSSIADAQNPNEISIFPNPLNQNKLNIDLGNFTGKTSIRIMDINGQVLVKQNVENTSRYQLDIHLKPGTYFVHLENKQQTIIKHLVVGK
jgi:xyloglucan-specific exo-beta-1,4-glucanase